MLSGSIVAIITPMHDDGSIDKNRLANLLDWHIEAKTTGIVVAGTTGESATLEYAEHADLISFVVKKIAGRIPVIAGTGTNSTRSTLLLTTQAKEAGADACLIVTPYYNKPTQNGLYLHYKTIAEQIDLPIIIYNVPSRTSCDILPPTIAHLSELKNIIGIKEATAELSRMQAIQKLVRSNFKIFSGDDFTALELMRHGAHGVISVTANVLPEKMTEMCTAALNNDLKHASHINVLLNPMHKNLFIETNPIPTKWALYKMGKIKSGIRLPLVPLDEKYHQNVLDAMQHAGVEIYA